MNVRHCALLACTTAMFSSAAFAGIRAGVETTVDAGATPPSTPGNTTGGNVVVNFDDQGQPCLFFETVALRNEYSGLGVAFSGPGPLDGGAILDACSSFGVSGYSAPNFLAFNCVASLSDGGVPDAPERLTFSSLVSFVQISVGTGIDPGVELSMQAYNDGDNLVAFDSVIVQSALQPVSVAAPDIRYVVIGAQSHPCRWVADDLSFEMGTVSVDPTSWGQMKSTYR